MDKQTNKRTEQPITYADLKHIITTLEKICDNINNISQTEELILQRVSTAIMPLHKNIEYRLMNYIGTEEERRYLLTQFALVSTHKMELFHRMIDEPDSRLLKHEYNKTLCTLEKLKYKLELWKKAHEKYIATTEHADNQKATDEEAEGRV